MDKVLRDVSENNVGKKYKTLYMLQNVVTCESIQINKPIRFYLSLPK